MDMAEFNCGKLVQILGMLVFVAAACPEGGSGGLGLSTLFQDKVPKGTLSFSPLSFGFHSSEKTRDPVGQAACKTSLCVLGSVSERHHRIEKQ